MSDQKNLIIAVILSIAVIMGFQFFYEYPRMAEEQARSEALEAARAEKRADQDASEAQAYAPVITPVPGAAGTAPVTPGSVAASLGDGVDKVVESVRLPVTSGRLKGSIALTGARIDDLSLVDYRETIEPESPQIVLLSPTGTEYPYYAEFGWILASGDATKLPSRDTVWRTTDSGLSPGRPVRLSWDNGAGLTFTRTYMLDEDYMFTVSQQVTNRGSEPVALYPFGLISRSGTPEVSKFVILHEGVLGYLNEELVEEDYEDIQEEGPQKFSGTGGWLGITDKYWLTTLVPQQDLPFTAAINHSITSAGDRYQVDYMFEAQQIPPGTSVEISNHLFTGAKEVNLLESYETALGISEFNLAIDWGYLRFLTQPLFYVLKWLNAAVGNFGIAILLLTVLIKLVFFPLANKSYTAMSKMRQLQPEITKLRERHKDDKQRMQQDMMALYKKEKVNPMAGCLPIVIQIPVFFALYKVLFVTIEMRQAPFFGWIQDLSAPDPLTVVNLFGLIPWDPPQMIAIGIWPLLMGASMFFQQKLNPQPADPVQAKIFMFMPIMFTFLLASFPAGLVIYWTWNNVLSIAQQWVIMRRMGVKI
jgi:YidC/Oxa1 family membrane protein insertase